MIPILLIYDIKIIGRVKPNAFIYLFFFVMCIAGTLSVEFARFESYGGIQKWENPTEYDVYTLHEFKHIIHVLPYISHMQLLKCSGALHLWKKNSI